MTRKLLSGVLAFAMVFGCTAPVALAEDTTVEEVEQYANLLPSLEKSEITMKNDEVAIIKVNDIGDDITASDVTFESSTRFTFRYVPESKSIMVTANDVDGIPAEGYEYTITINTSGKADKYGSSTLTLKIKGPAAATAITGWPTGSTMSVSTNKPESFTLKAGDKAPASVTTKVTTDGQEYISVAVTDVDGGKKVTVTGLKATPDTGKKVAFTVTADGVSKEYTVTVTAAKTATAVTLKVDKTAIATKTGSATLVAQPYKLDDYGDLTTDDGAPLVWYINGTEIGADGLYTVKDKNTDKLLATLAGTGAIRTFSAEEAGTYNITVTDQSGSVSAYRTITVTDSATVTGGYIATSATTLAADTKLEVTVKPGSTVDLGKLIYAVNTKVNNVPGKALMSNFSDVTVSYANGAARLASAFDAKTGVITVEDADDVDLKTAMGAGDGVATIPVTITFKKGTTTLNSIEYKIKVTNAAKDIGKIEYSIGGEVFFTGTKSGIVNKGLPVMTVGKTVDVDAKLSDGNGFTDGINQGVIWEIRHIYSNDNPVYATVDANGVVTPLVKCTGKAVLKVVPVADTTADNEFPLYIMEDPTATVAPTEKPTEAPTQAPETKTGTVNTSSSALNIRAAASTGATVVAKAAKGSTVTILGEENGFYKVQLADGTVGYASKAYIKVTTDTPVVTITATTTANLKLRTSAPSGSVITVMPKGATVKVIEGGQSWAKVEYNGKVGYASNNYLTFNTVG